MHRSKSLSDDATPAGNGIAAVALVRMGYLLGETRYLDAAERTLRAAMGGTHEVPAGTYESPPLRWKRSFTRPKL